MKIIFLDIDGVLNYMGCKHKSPSGCLGIDPMKVALLKQIIDETDAKIVLTSTWKTEWYRTEYIEDLSRDGQYLVKQLAKSGVKILDKTEDSCWAQRGAGILSYLNNVDCDKYVILDDESFDFLDVGIQEHHVKTSFYNNGLNEKQVEEAILKLS